MIGVLAMNHIYRVVYNHHTNTYQAVPEISKGAHKTHSECNQDGTFTQSSLGNVPFFRTALTTLAVVITALGAQRAHAAPLGGQVSAGQATIQQNGKVTDIHQTSQKAAINWQKFGIKADETVNFKQPNAQSVTLNRVIGNEKSVIDGAMKANGKVFITNPNGVMIGNGAKINVGALLATTGKISDSDFMAGNYRFQDAKGSVENYGEITVPEGGAVALIAPVVRNQGTIKAPQGNALLASAEQFSVTLQDDNFAYTLDKGTLQGLVDNGGAIYADAGHIVLTAKGVDMVKKSLIKHSGIVEANTVRSKNGVIELLGDLDNTRLEVSGSLKAEAKENSDGGFIETSAAEVKIQETAQVSTRADNGKSGKWLLDPNDLIIGQGGVMTGGQVNDALKNNGDFELKSTQGKASGKGDVIINDEIQWNRGKLTVNAENDIHINKTLTGTGTASLALEYGQGTSDGGESDYYLQKDTPIKDRTVKVNLPEGYNFSIKKGSNSYTKRFSVIHQMPSDASLDENVAFGSDMDLSSFSNRQGFNGFAMYYHNNIHGLGHKLSNLSINSTQNSTGFVSGVGHTDYLRDFSLDNISITSTGENIGILSGWSAGTVKNIAVTNSSVSGGKNVGGLIGSNLDDIYLGMPPKGIVDNIYVQANVKSDDFMMPSSGTGGIIGNSEKGVLNNAEFKGTISGQSNVGGLIGSSSNTNINNSFADANIQSGNFAGGLIGLNVHGQHEINNSASIGKIISTAGSVGGLVGSSGGLANLAITNSYSLNDLNMGRMTTTNIPNSRGIGGIIGEARGDNIVLNNVYSAGKITSISTQTPTGGLIGYSKGNITINNSFFDQNATNQDKAIGSTNTVSNNHGQSTERMKQKSTFKDWDFDTVWRIDEGNDYPRLRALTEGTIIVTPTPPTANKPDVGVQAHDLKKVYDGKEVNTEEHLRTIATANGYSDIVSVSGLKDGDTLSSLGGLTYGGTWQGAKNAGQYSIVPSGLNGGQKYEIKYGEGSLTIDKRPIAISGSRQYDGTYNAYGSVDTKKLKENLVGDDANQVGDSDVIIVSNAGKLAEKDASEQKVKMTEKAQPVFVTNATNSMSVMQNYDVDTANSDWLINKKDLTITAMNNIKPEGTNNPDLSHIGVLVDGLVKGEKISDVGLSYSDDKKWQGEISIIRVGEPTFAVGKASNYAITKKDGKLLTVQKDYDLNNLNKSPEEVAKIRDLLNSVEDEILLASAVYKDSDGKFKEIYEVLDKATGKVVNKILVAEGSSPLNNEFFSYRKSFGIVDKVDRGKDDFANGLGVALYEKQGSDKYYLVFRGTDTTSFLGVINPFDPQGDGGSNLGQGAGFRTEQYSEAAIIAKNLLKDNPKADITFVGHSLGGGLATYASSQLGNEVPTVTFNPAALNGFNIADKFSRYPNIHNIIFDNEINQWTNSIISSYIGNKYKIDFLPHKGITGVVNMNVSDHLMSHVIKTQRLADIISKNNEIMFDCNKSNDCVVMKENSYVPPITKVPFNQHDQQQRIIDLITQRDKIQREIDELTKQGKDTERKSRDLEHINKEISMRRTSWVYGDTISIERNRGISSYVFEAKKGWQAQDGDIIRTLDKEVTIYFPDGSWIRLAPNSSVRIKINDTKDDGNVISARTLIAENIILLTGNILKKGIERSL